MSDDIDAQVVLFLVRRGRDAARSIGSIAEELGWDHRRVERAAQAIAAAGLHPLVAATSGEHRGIYLAQTAAELRTYTRTLRDRVRSQMQRVNALENLARRMQPFEQRTLW